MKYLKVLIFSLLAILLILPSVQIFSSEPQDYKYFKQGFIVTLPANTWAIEQPLDGIADVNVDLGQLSWGDSSVGGYVRVLWFRDFQHANLSLEAAIDSVIVSYDSGDGAVYNEGVSKLSQSDLVDITGNRKDKHVPIVYKLHLLNFFGSELYGVVSAYECPAGFIFVSTLQNSLDQHPNEKTLSGIDCGKWPVKEAHTS